MYVNYLNKNCYLDFLPTQQSQSYRARVQSSYVLRLRFSYQLQRLNCVTCLHATLTVAYELRVNLRTSWFVGYLASLAQKSTS